MPPDRRSLDNDPAASTATRDRILDAAEHLFADFGFGGASLRMITERAGVNLAAANYHFGSKESLYQRVFIRRIRPMNQQRMERLDEAERSAGGRPIDLHLLLDILLRPIVELATSTRPDPHPFARVMTRNLIEPQPFMQEVVAQELGPILQRVAPLFRATVPHLDIPTLIFRVRFLMGATNITYAAVPLFPAIKATAATEPELQLQHLIVFAEAGLRAPLPTSSGDPS